MLRKGRRGTAFLPTAADSLGMPASSPGLPRRARRLDVRVLALAAMAVLACAAALMGWRAWQTGGAPVELAGAVLRILAAGLLAGAALALPALAIARPLRRLAGRLLAMRASRYESAGALVAVAGRRDEIGFIAEEFDAIVAELHGLRRQLQEQTRLANSALVATVGLLQGRSVELQQRTETLERALVEISQLAMTDGLTGIRNRRYFEERATEAMARCQRYNEPVAMVLFDVDHFKAINDRHGHPAGDTVLRELAQLVGSRIRATDVFARLGGDEFGILLIRASAAESQAFAEEVRALVAGHRFLRGGAPLSVTLSMGVGHFTFAPKSLETLYQAADEALYRSKRDGRNRVTLSDAAASA